MAFIGDIFHAIGGLFSPHTAPPVAPPVTPPKPAAPQQQAGTKPTTDTADGNPSFLAAAALPNYGAQVGAQSNPGGKSLLGQ